MVYLIKKRANFVSEFFKLVISFVAPTEYDPKATKTGSWNARINAGINICYWRIADFTSSNTETTKTDDENEIGMGK
jgi:hypothetical protein